MIGFRKVIWLLLGNRQTGHSCGLEVAAPIISPEKLGAGSGCANDRFGFKLCL
jgi:hypothetical protein